MKQFLLVGLAILAVASARVVREAPKEDTFKEKIESGLKDVDKLVQDLTGANTGELKQKADEHVELVLTQFQEWAKKLQEEANKMQESDVVKDLRQSIDHGVEEFRKTLDTHVTKFKEDQPETYNQISQHVDTVKSTSSTIIAKIEELSNSDEAKHLKESSLKFIDELKKTLTEGVEKKD